MDAERAATYLGIGLTKFYELVKARELPQPIEIGGCVRWDRCELDSAFDNFKERRTRDRAHLEGLLEQYDGQG